MEPQYDFISPPNEGLPYLQRPPLRTSWRWRPSWSRPFQQGRWNGFQLRPQDRSGERWVTRKDPTPRQRLSSSVPSPSLPPFVTLLKGDVTLRERTRIPGRGAEFLLHSSHDRVCASAPCGEFCFQDRDVLGCCGTTWEGTDSFWMRCRYLSAKKKMVRAH